VLKNKKAYYLPTLLKLFTRGLEGEGLRYRALLLTFVAITISFVVLAAPIMCNMFDSSKTTARYDTGPLTKSLAKTALDVGGDSDGEPLNSTAVDQWAATIIAGSLALIALIVVVMVVAMFRRQSKEGGK